MLAEPTQETKIVLPVLAQETEKALPELGKEDIELLFPTFTILKESFIF